MRWIVACVVFAPVVAAAEPLHGLTVEAGFGGGFVRTPDPYSRLDSVTFGGSAGAGVWLTPRLALMGRVTLQHYKWVSGDDSTDYRYWFAGPSAQYWLTDWLWASGGAGLAVYSDKTESSDDYTSWYGLGFDARVGVTAPLIDSSRHKIEAWLEVQPGSYRAVQEDHDAPQPTAWDTYVQFSLNVGYQFR